MFKRVNVISYPAKNYIEKVLINYLHIQKKKRFSSAYKELKNSLMIINPC